MIQRLTFVEYSPLNDSAYGLNCIARKLNEIIDYLKAEEERTEKLRRDLDKNLDKFVDKLNGGR